MQSQLENVARELFSRPLLITALYCHHVGHRHPGVPTQQRSLRQRGPLETISRNAVRELTELLFRSLCDDAAGHRLIPQCTLDTNRERVDE